MTSYLLVEIEKALRAVDIVKRGKACDSTINIHRMNSQCPSAGNK